MLHEHSTCQSSYLREDQYMMNASSTMHLPKGMLLQTSHWWKSVMRPVHITPQVCLALLSLNTCLICLRCLSLSLLAKHFLLISTQLSGILWDPAAQGVLTGVSMAILLLARSCVQATSHMTQPDTDHWHQ